MGYVFPKNLYADVRVEHIFTTDISYLFRDLENCRVKKYDAAFIRVYDGKKWYYSSTTDINNIQKKIDELAGFAERNNDIYKNAIYEKFSENVDTVMLYEDCSVSQVSLDDKIALLQKLMPHMENEELVKMWSIKYIDEYKVKEFYNSKGASLKFDYQRCGFSCRFSMADGDRLLNESCQNGELRFSDIKGFEEELSAYLRDCREFLLNSEAVVPGKYTVILEPVVAGVFTHECFGHKSESDFMLGDEAMRKEWAIGKRLGNEELTIIDDGGGEDFGYTPYDDEGNKSEKTYLVRNGVLTGRLHNSVSAAYLEESVTGNGRAVSYEYEPIVRMTTTYMDSGSKSVEQLISEVDSGILVKNIAHGSGMSTFTIAPTMSYYIKNGKIDKPVRISVISGNVFEALSDIDGLSDKAVIKKFVTGGCGKMAQHPLTVAFGGPYVRVKNMNVQ